MNSYRLESPKRIRLRDFGNQETSRKCLICLDLMTSIQPATEKTNFDIVSRKLQKISCKTFRRKTSLAQFRECLNVSFVNPLSKIARGNISLLTHPRDSVFTFMQILVFLKTHSLLKAIFRVKKFFALWCQIKIWD